MCAILGILGKKLPDIETVIKARDTMAHRGPDDAGIYYSPKERVALGHRRLSIIDLSRDGRQPFSSYDGRYVIVYNGEIYNFKELKKKLKPYYPFTTSTDTEVLLAAYIHWGKDCLRELNGMFAFAIFDRRTKILFASRDRLGIKPFYWAVYNGNFYFASEIKGILASGNLPRKLDKRGFLDYFSYRNPLGDKTFFEGIRSLLPGHYVVVKNEKLPKPCQYWELPVVTEKEDTGEEEAFCTTEKLLIESVRSHMISDVPLGTYLSGGLDSSILTALAASLSSKKIKTFSIGMEGDKDIPYARMAALHLNTDHHEVVISDEEYFDLIPNVIAYKDAPLTTPHEVPLYVLSKELKKNITVVLSGEGADELFGGYGRIFRSGYDFERMQKLRNNVFFREEERSIMQEKFYKEYNGKTFSSSIDHFLDQYSYINQNQKEELLSTEYFQKEKTDILNKAYFIPHFERIEKLSPTEQYMSVFQKTHLRGLLERLDIPTMAASVEGRVPFVDHTLIEYVSSLPLHYKLRWRSQEHEEKAKMLLSSEISENYDITKYILRKIGARYLPKEIIDRKKVGFMAQLNYQFEDKTCEMVRDLLMTPNSLSRPLYNISALNRVVGDGHITQDKNRALTLWMFINIEIWMREYNITI